VLQNHYSNNLPSTRLKPNINPTKKVFSKSMLSSETSAQHEQNNAERGTLGGVPFSNPTGGLISKSPSWLD
jgi:hypothetical protein